MYVYVNGQCSHPYDLSIRIDKFTVRRTLLLLGSHQSNKRINPLMNTKTKNTISGFMDDYWKCIVSFTVFVVFCSTQANTGNYICFVLRSPSRTIDSNCFCMCLRVCASMWVFDVMNVDLVLNVVHLHTKYEICPSFPSWDIVFTSMRPHTHTYIHTHIHTHIRHHDYIGYDIETKNV